MAKSPFWESFQRKKEKLVAELKGCPASGSFSLGKSTSNLFRARPLAEQVKRLDVRAFNQVLEIDSEAMTAHAEGMATYEKLVDATLPFHLLPPVVPQLKTITIGGAVAGLGIESSSFRYGLVHETILEMEILLSDGQIVICTPDNEYSDLFFAFPNTYGTLGYILRVKVRLIPARKYLKLAYYPFTASSEYFQSLEKLCMENRSLDSAVAYIDGVIFNEHEMYITTAQFVDNAPYVSNYRYMNIYYQSIKTRREDFLTSYDYIWRWDTDWFWCSQVFGLQNWLIRLLLGKWLLGSKTYNRVMHFFYRHPRLKKILLDNPKEEESVIQDVLIPIQNCPLFLDFLLKDIGLLPIWICPTYSCQSQSQFNFCPLASQKLYLDFGFWGSVPKGPSKGHHNRQVEREAASLAGLKSLYSSSFYAEEEFWGIYDRELYFKLKEKYDPNRALKTLYQKCCQRA